jgi:Fe2+ transport system protein B
MEVEIVSSGMVGVILLVGFVVWLIAVFILLLDISGYLRRIANASDNQRY